MASLLLHNCAFVATMDDAGTVVVGGSVFVIDNAIEQIGPAAALPSTADVVVDGSKLVVLPGLVNTHHHFTQTLTRAVPGAQDAVLFDWLRTLYPIWARLTPEAVYHSSKLAMAELMLSGCTTSSDHTYIWPNGSQLDDQIRAAAEMGMRFHAARGSMSVGESQGGLPPDSIVEDEKAVLRDSQRLIEQYHNTNRFAMLRIVLAPCSPFTVSADLMRESIALARAYNVHGHTHLAETRDEHEYCLARFGKTPVEFAADLGWLGADVWHAHMVHPSAAEVLQLGSTGTGVAHCPSSNMRLASGIAPLRGLQRSGARVGLGVDGSASNDSQHVLEEARMAMLLQRVGGDPAGITARQALRLATRGGAEVLGRDDIGYLAPGMAADIVGYRVDSLALAGAAVHDPLAALVFCRPPNVDLSIIDGRVRIRDGEFGDLDLPALVARHNALARALVQAD